MSTMMLQSEQWKVLRLNIKSDGMNPAI